MKKSLVLFLMFLLSVLLASAISGLIVALLGVFNLSDSFNNFIAYSLLLTVCLLIMGLFGRVFNWQIPTFRPQPERLNLPLIVLSLVTIYAISILTTPLVELVPDVMMDDLYASISGGFWSMITAVLMAPLLEEFLFRGTLQRNFSRFLGPFWGILISTIIFSAIHIIPQQMVGVFFVGLVIAVVYELTKSLSTVILIHLLNNGLAYLLYMAFGEDNTISENFLGEGTTLHWVIYSISALYVALIGYWAVRKLIAVQKSTKTEKEVKEI